KRRDGLFFTGTEFHDFRVEALRIARAEKKELRLAGRPIWKGGVGAQQNRAGVLGAGAGNVDARSKSSVLADPRVGGVRHPISVGRPDGSLNFLAACEHEEEG